MGRKKKIQSKELIITPTDVAQLQKEYAKEIDEDPQYSLEPDPTGELQMSETQKDFIRHYVEFKNINTAAELTYIDADTAKAFFVAYNTQQEIRRINRALYHRQFASKLVSLDDIGGYLSSLLTGDNVPLADQLKTTEKLRVVELLLRVNEMKSQSMQDPSQLAHSDIESQLKNLSVKTIQQLLVQNNTVVVQQKNDAINKLDDGTLSVEEKAYLSSLPMSELLKLIDETNKEVKTK
jgi:hypothetical protein